MKVCLKLYDESFFATHHDVYMKVEIMRGHLVLLVILILICIYGILNAVSVISGEMGKNGDENMQIKLRLKAT